MPKEIAIRIVKKVDLCKDDHWYFLEKLTDDEGYKLRIGDYRAIIDIVEDENTIAVRIVGHRRNIYKRRS